APGGKKGRGQACKHSKEMYIARPGSDNIMPEIIRVPPTALSKFEEYSFLLLGKQLFLHGVVTEFGLVREQNKGGLPYSRLSFRPVAALTTDAMQRFEDYTGYMRELWKHVAQVEQKLVDVQPAPQQVDAGAPAPAAQEGKAF